MQLDNLYREIEAPRRQADGEAVTLFDQTRSRIPPHRMAALG